MKDLSPMTLALFFGSIVLEVWFSARDHRGFYDRRDTLTNLAIAGIGFFVNVFFRAVALVFLGKIGSYAVFDAGSGVIALLVLFLIADLCEYLFHLLGHKTRFFWAAHVMHHSSEKLNFTTALRIPFTNAWCRYMAYTPAALLGYSAISIMWIDSLILTYSFFLHTEAIRKLGVLEYIFNTPSHHRVHHASNQSYIDKNFGAVLIIWDRIFGTFQEEKEAPIYGLTKPLHKPGVATVILHEWKDLFRDLFRARTWLQRIKIILGKPGAHTFAAPVSNTCSRRASSSMGLTWVLTLTVLLLTKDGVQTHKAGNHNGHPGANRPTPGNQHYTAKK
jgi:sterol desaturase/sphingolipid hydroxylase (fatty acid hydroxylase superfamily)